MGGTADFSHSTFDSNLAESGGAIYATATTTISSCQIVNSFASEAGAVLYSVSSVTISDSIVAESSAGTVPLFSHDAGAETLLVLDTVEFRNNSEVPIFNSDETNVVLRNCYGLTGNWMPEDGLVRCDEIGTYCPAEYCTDVDTGVSVRFPPFHLSNFA